MEQRLANTWRMTINEKKFIETALQSDLRIDGRCPFDYRRLSIKFGREDGSSEVQLGQTHVMGFVTAQLVQPFRDRPNEGTLAIYTEFSPMADPAFEVGRPGESAVELARIIDRGLRESRAVDTESLCVVAGKLVWSIRVDIHILDNGGNLVDAANIAALAALLTFRRPECSLGGEDGQEVEVHPPEVREPLPLIVHHLPIAVTFAFIGSEDAVVIDPTHFEEAIMGGRMTTTLNMNGDVCAVQKAGGDGIMQSVILQCLRIASVKAGDMTTKIKTAVESYNTERALRKVKRHTPATAVSVGEPDLQKDITDFASNHVEKLRLIPEESTANKKDAMDVDTEIVEIHNKNKENKVKSFTGGSSSWDPYSRKGVDVEQLRASLASQGAKTAVEKPNNNMHGGFITDESDQLPTAADATHAPLVGTTGTELQASGKKTLKDAVKPKHKRKKKSSSSSAAS